MVNIGAIVACQMACNVSTQNAIRLQQDYNKKNSFDSVVEKENKYNHNQNDNKR